MDRRGRSTFEKFNDFKARKPADWKSMSTDAARKAAKTCYLEAMRARSDAKRHADQAEIQARVIAALIRHQAREKKDAKNNDWRQEFLNFQEPDQDDDDLPLTSSPSSSSSGDQERKYNSKYNSNSCQICFEVFDDNRRRLVVTGCGHTACFSCMARLVKNNEKCHKCRGIIHEVVKVYDLERHH